MDYTGEPAGLPIGSMETFTGLYVNLDNPDPSTIVLEDIAHHLSLICRYNGACKFHYSVAQHSVLVSEAVKGNRITRLGGLLHDANEAYLGDVIRPNKYRARNSEIRQDENRFQHIINEKFGIASADWEAIREADDIVIATEAAELVYSKGRGWKGLPPADERYKNIRELAPAFAERMFLAKYRWLTEE